eukprot:TRINITY_DN409_c0_g1_i1.p1 TRINITY_DN409_c0_g1~~TRINITY_DN409_c0_g1_i1.p1  ORF type:complete len:490 (-),score=86.35 TRINITY_DN409_c0_g1_i1:95-1522(-)
MGTSASSPLKVPYEHSDRQMPYRTEELEISSEEQVTLNHWQTASLQHAEEETLPPVPSTCRNVVFDTDLGTDIDDALALLLALRLPAEDMRLIGITTVYGYTNIRTQVTQAIVDGWKKGESPSYDVPVVEGNGLPLGTHRPPWHTGTEGYPVMSWDEVAALRVLHDDEWLSPSPKFAKARDKLPFNIKAAQFIVDTVNQFQGRKGETIEIVSLGAMSNIALALRIDPAIQKVVDRITFMGIGKSHSETGDSFEPGKVYSFFPNHNVSCDTLACVEVFESEIPIDVVSDAATNACWFGSRPGYQNPRSPVSYLMGATSPPEIALVGELLKVWLSFRSSMFHKTVEGTCPHDALTVAEAVYPGKFVKYERGHILIHRWAGFTSFVPDPLGRHRLSTSVDHLGFLKWFTSQILPSTYKLPKGFFRKVDEQKVEEEKRREKFRRMRENGEEIPLDWDKPPQDEEKQVKKRKKRVVKKEE